MLEQEILVASENYVELDGYIQRNGFKTVFLVCGESISLLPLNTYFENLEDRMGVKVVKFSEFQPNPRYESVVKGVEIFNREQCDVIFAVGGGSAMDVAKCIKLFANMSHNMSYLEQEIIPNDIALLAVPTTAGTGSEATRYAVIYYNGEKQSVSDYSCIPSAVLMDSTVLKTLPEYQKKATMLDALCHAIESYWSVNSTEESKAYSREAIQMVLENREKYLNNEDHGNKNMLIAANIAGKAINITQTTAGHAMCYKITSLYGIAHGHAVAICLSKLWMHMLNNMDACLDVRGKEYLKTVFRGIADAMGCETEYEAVYLFDDFVSNLGLINPKAKQEEYEILCRSVNTVRLRNNPVELDVEDIRKLYKEIL